MRAAMLSAAAYTMGWDSRKDLFGGGNSRERDYVCEGSWGASVTIRTPCMMGWMRQRYG
jgi:hypothetical protein